MNYMNIGKKIFLKNAVVGKGNSSVVEGMLSRHEFNPPED